MRVMDLTGRSRRTIVEVEAAPAYELLMSLATFSEAMRGETFEAGPDWLESVRATASPDLLAAVEHSGLHLGRMWCHLVGLAYESPAPKDVPAFLTHLEETGPFELRLHMLGYYLGAIHRDVDLDVIRAAAEGDAAAQQRVLEDAYCHDPGCSDAMRHVLSLAPEEARAQALDILRGWYDEIVRPREAEIMAILTRDAAAKRKLIGTMPTERLVDLATNGLQYTPEAGVRRVLLVPTVAYRPWVLITEHRDTRIFCYPVADESLEAGTEPSPARLVRMYKALSDERRLQILRRLATQSYTLQEMADYLGIGKSLMHHHLATLRAAGLVRVRLGPDKRYDLRPDVIAEMPGLLDGYLHAPADEGVPRATRAAQRRRK